LIIKYKGISDSHRGLNVNIVDSTIATRVVVANTVQEHAKEARALNQIIASYMNEISDLSAQIATAAEGQSSAFKTK
jgi:hypothetical protein